MAHHSRRTVLAALAGLAVPGCSQQNEGTEEIHYGREACAKCGMIISDPHFAAEIRGGPDLALAKFDDVGCAVNWLEKKPWRAETTTRFWVMNGETGKEWLDARSSWYIPGMMSPMNYGFGAVAQQKSGAVDFATMQAQALAKG